VLSLASQVQATPTLHNISAGYITLTNNPGNDTVTTSALPYSFNGFRLLSASLGKAQIQIGTSATDDSANGILLSAVALNGTTNYGSNNYSISMIETNSNGSYHIAVYQSGNSNQLENCDIVGAYFPYSSWIGGHLRSNPYGNGFTNNLFTGTPGLVYGVNVADLKLTQNLGGRSLVSLTNLGINSQTDGILIVNHGKDRSGDGNYAVSFANPDGTWTVWVRDHTGGSEQDPMAFVYIPKTNTTVVSGKFKGTDAENNLILMYSGNSPAFTVQNVGGGRWDLRIPGYGPTNGVLILSGEGGGTQNADNCYTYQAHSDGTGWEIQSRDLPGGGLQTPDNGTVPICDFVFIPGPTPSISVTPTNNLQTTEAGGTATFSVVLESQPTANVTINVTSSDTTEGTVDKSTLTFTSVNWNVPQVVTITGVDDPDQDGSIPYTIQLSTAVSTDPNYNGKKPSDVSVVNIDNEPGISLTKNNVVTTEAGGADTFGVFLNTQPTADVTINLSSSNTGEGTVSPTSLTFNSGNWNVPQTVTVTGVDDSIDDGDVAYTIITSAATSGDPIYNGYDPLDVSAVNVDNDTAGLTFSSSSLVVQEPSSSTNFTVVLNSQPTANVTVTISSSDTTEGTVSPSSRTFTSANWATPQSFTLTAVDDSVNDGNVTYPLNVSVSSSDPLYAALTPTIIATTLDNEAGLTLPSGTVLYGVGQPGVGIDGLATVTDIDSSSYNGGTLTFALTAGATADDRLEIRNDGTGTDQVSVSGNVVSVGGVSVGTFSGGTGTSPLVVTFNGSSSPAAAQDIIRATTYRNADNAAPGSSRTLTLTLADGVGGTSTASKLIQISLLHISDFQDGVDRGFGVYTNEKDIELSSLQPDSAFPAGSDALNGLVVATLNNQTLMSFDNIVGSGPGQIPAGAEVVSADLILNATVSGLGSPLYLMLMPFDATNDTFNSWGGGIVQDNTQSSNVFYSQIGTFPTSGATTVGSIVVSVLPDVQAWVNGLPNYGWIFPGWSTGGARTCFSPSETTNALNRPHLRVKWVPAGTPSVAFRYGVNGYTNAVDTSIRKGSPDSNHGADTTAFVDGEVTAPLNDPEQVLLRFDNIIGGALGQLPPNAQVQAAILDIGSTIGDAMGDGGQAYAMLTPWQDSDSWNSLGGNGISPDGVQAASVPTFTAGNSSLTPDVQGGYLTFDVTTDVQAWDNAARPNYGWVMIPWPAGGNGWGFATAENAATNSRPQLRVYYTGGSVVVTPIHIVSITGAPAAPTLHFTGPASSPATIYRSGTVDGTYTSIGTTTFLGDGTGSFPDPTPLTGQAFYKVSSP
jgi:hypothetical protein